MPSALADPSNDKDRRRLIVILSLAVLQGLALFGLQRAAEHDVWPATQLAAIVPFYLLVTFLPLTTQLLARFIDQRRLWWSLGGIAVALGVFGWHFAVSVAPEPKFDTAAELAFQTVAPLVVLWLIAVAFLRAQLESRSNSPNYRALFAAAWRNKLTLLEAGIFVGVFWALLALCAALFASIGIRFFVELFSKPLFIYLATAIAWGLALNLIGSIDRMVDVALVQVLSLFKWLAPVAGLIVISFAFALMPELGGLLARGERALDAVWLLWLVAVTILLINAAYQDGTGPRPYGAKLSVFMRVVPPLLLLIALTATYALYVRVDAFGLTVGRFWGLVTAGVGVAHAAAATVAALRSGPWLGFTSTTNPLLAAALVVVLTLALTPVLSPYRLSASSQQGMALRPTAPGQVDGALSYLRFNAGGYGRRALQVLAERQGDATTDTLAVAAQRMLEQQYPTFPGYPTSASEFDFDAWWSEVRVYPADRPVPAELLTVLRSAGPRPVYPGLPPAFALWVDVVGGPEPELFVSLSNYQYELYSLEGTDWRQASRGFAGSPLPADSAVRDAALASGDFAAEPRELRDIRVGNQRLQLTPQDLP